MDFFFTDNNKTIHITTVRKNKEEEQEIYKYSWATITDNVQISCHNRCWDSCLIRSHC